MRILVYGCGKIGGTVLKQLAKNPSIETITMDPREKPEAVDKGIVGEIDIAEPLTPMVLERIEQTWEPDVIVLATSSGDLALGNAPGIELMMQSLWTEIASISEVPVLPIDRLAGSFHVD